MILITCIFLLALYSILTSILLFNMVKREESMEVFYEEKAQQIEEKLIQIKLRVEDTVRELNQVDIRGSFEADDEVGFAFKEIKKINEELLEFIIEYNKQNENA